MRKIAFKMVFLVLGTFSLAKAQVKVGDNPTSINANSVLEMESANKGMLLPRVKLVETTDVLPLTLHIEGMVVYNTATAGDVTPGYYYNDGTKWVRLGAANGGDQTKDAWIDDSTKGLIKLGTKSDGTSARSSEAEFTIFDTGMTLIGEKAIDGDILDGTYGLGNIASVVENTDDKFWKQNGVASVFIDKNTSSSAAQGAFWAKTSKEGNLNGHFTSAFLSLENNAEDGAMGNLNGVFSLVTNSQLAGSVESISGISSSINNASTESEVTNFNGALIVNQSNTGAAKITNSKTLWVRDLVRDSDMVDPTQKFGIYQESKTIGSNPNNNATKNYFEDPIGIGVLNPVGMLDVGGTGSMKVPVGTTAERPATPTFGMIRYNSTIGRGEMYVNDENGDGTLGDAGWRAL